MADFDDLLELIIKFRNERNWKQFHKPKEMAISLSLEAAELLEHFQWKSNEQIEEYLRGDGKAAVSEELSDVLYWVLLMAHDFDIDLSAVFRRKMEKNALKYPVEQSSGRHLKYDKL